MPGNNLNRRFRERVPQPSPSDACPNYCHEEASRKVSQRFNLDRFVGDSDDLMTRVRRWREPVRGRSKNPNLPMNVHQLSMPRTDPRRRPWSNTGALSGRFAVGGGRHFDALRMPGLDSPNFVFVTLQWENQRFEAAATDWEKKYSPLLSTTRVSGSMTPLVDAQGYVISYVGRDDPSNLWRVPDQQIMYMPDVSGSFVRDRKEAATLRQRGWDHLSGGDDASFIVNINGEILHYTIEDRPLEPANFWPSLVLSLGGSLVFGLTKAGIRTLVTKATLTGTSKAVPSGMLKRLLHSGKYAQGGSDKVSLFHGTTHTGRVGIEKGGLILRKGAGATDDFGDGFYMTLDSRVAQKTSAVRTFSGSGGGKPKTTAVLQVDVETKQLGKIVDIRKGGMHRDLWEKYLDEPLMPGTDKTIGWATRTAQDRGKLFEGFLKKHGLGEADSVIGPLGDKYTSGLAALPSGEVSNQLVLRSQTVLDRVTRIIKGQQ